MKFSLKTSIASSVLLALSTTNVIADVQVYGKANVSINSIDNSTSDQWEVNSNASRIGIKGEYQVSEGIEAIYKMEFETFIDDGDKGGKVFSQRNIYAGFKGDFGQLVIGKSDTPLKVAQGKIDRFNDQKLADIKNYVEGEDRVSNIAIYTTPYYNGFSAKIAVIAGEDADSGNDGLAEGTSIAVEYKNEWLRASIANNSDVDAQDTTRFVVEGSFGSLKVGAMAQAAEKIDGSADEDSMLISGEYKLGNGFVAKAQYGTTDYSNDNTDSQIAIGVDKKLNKTTKLFAYYSAIEQDKVSEIHDKNAFGLGFEMKF